MQSSYITSKTNSSKGSFFVLRINSKHLTEWAKTSESHNWSFYKLIAVKTIITKITITIGVTIAITITPILAKVKNLNVA